MELQVKDNVEPTGWNAAITSLGGTINHSSTWAGYIRAAQPNAVPRYMTLVSGDGEIVAAALGFETRSTRRLLAPLTGRLEVATMPVVRAGDEVALPEFLRRLEQYARKCGCTELFVGSSASRSGAEELEQSGFALTRRLEFELAIGRPEDDLLKAMQYKRRKNIKKAMRMGVNIRDLPGEEGVSELRRLQGHSSERILARGGRDITHEGPSSADPVMVLLDSGLGRIVCAEVNGQVVSAGLFTCFNGLVYHTLSGHSSEALKTQAPTLLIWETIRRYRGEGAGRFNFGGCKIEAVNEGHPEHGVYSYKKAFGTECIKCASGTKILRKTAHRIVHCLKVLLRR